MNLEQAIIQATFDATRRNMKIDFEGIRFKDHCIEEDVLNDDRVLDAILEVVREHLDEAKSEAVELQTI